MPQITRFNELRRKNKKVQGRWQLDPRHRLSYRSEEGEEEFEFATSLVAAEEEALVFSVTEKQKNGRRVTSLARLSGKWQANEKNQLEFEVERASGKKDVLIFTGAWKVGESQEIIYSYRRHHSKRKTAQFQTLTFKGWWNISEDNRLTYLVEGSSDSAFRFRGTFQTTSILAKKGEIRYQLGTELAQKGKSKTIVLFGKWKISDKLELIFEMEGTGKRKREIRFGAEFSPAEDFSIAASLINKEGDPLGMEVVLTKDFLKTNAQGFIRLKKTLAESAVEAGVTLPW